MKKILFILTICLLFTGCSLIPRKTIINNIENTNENVIETSYGSFTIPNTWVKRNDHSTSSKYFFANKNDKNDIPNNISVEMGTNKYSKDDHISFRNAITSQLTYQVKPYGYAIKGNGSNTKNGYVYYTFIVEGGSPKTIQHYIVGDYKYVLIHESIWDNKEADTNNAAKTIIDSFKWKE